MGKYKIKKRRGAARPQSVTQASDVHVAMRKFTAAFMYTTLEYTLEYNKHFMECQSLREVDLWIRMVVSQSSLIYMFELTCCVTRCVVVDE